MIVRNLSLRNFRNYQNIKVNFSTTLNVIVGKNGSGKTNLVESIHYLSLAKSFRLVDDEELIAHNQDFAEINAELSEGETKRTVTVIISKQGKTILVNGKKIEKLSSLSKLINVIIFEPSDVLLFKDSPSKRRRFLDVAISKQNSLYLERLIIYEKLLKERNDILKGENIDPQHLEIVTEQLIRAAEPIVRERAHYVQRVNEVLNKIVPHITNETKTLELKYQPFVQYDENFLTNAKEALKRAEEGDIKRKATSIGPHREDLSMNLNGRDIATFGSQGENRIASLALILSPYFLIDDGDKKPIVILDDVMSELDEIHQQKLLVFVKKLRQVFITTTNIKVNDACIYKVSGNTIERRKS